MERKFRYKPGTGYLPRLTTFRPIRMPSLHLEAKVSELILPNQLWNESLIEQNFTRVDAEIIKRILLPRTPQEYEVIWHYDRKACPL